MRLWVLKMNTLVFLNSKKCDSLITYLIVCQKKIFKLNGGQAGESAGEKN